MTSAVFSKPLIFVAIRWTAEPHKRGVTSNQKSKNFLDICVRCRGAYFAWLLGRFELWNWRKALLHLGFRRYFSSVIFVQNLSNSSWFQVLETRLPSGHVGSNPTPSATFCTILCGKKHLNLVIFAKNQVLFSLLLAPKIFALERTRKFSPDPRKSLVA